MSEVINRAQVKKWRDNLLKNHSTLERKLTKVTLNDADVDFKCKVDNFFSCEKELEIEFCKLEFINENINEMIVNFVQLLTDLGELFDEKSHYNLENKELKNNRDNIYSCKNKQNVNTNGLSNNKINGNSNNGGSVQCNGGTQNIAVGPLPDSNETSNKSNIAQDIQFSSYTHNLNDSLSPDNHEVTNNLNATNPRKEPDQQQTDDNLMRKSHIESNSSKIDSSGIELEKKENVEIDLTNNPECVDEPELQIENESVIDLEQKASLDSNELVNSNKESRQKNIDSMWQVLEPNSELKYRKDHQFAQFMPSLGIGTVSVRGRSHEHNATFRDDHSLVERFNSGWTLLAVADGAGSCRYSRKGSKIALETCLDYVRESIEKFNIPDVEKQINNLLNQEAAPESLGEAQHYLANFNQKVLFEAGKRAVRAIEIEVENSEEEVSYKDYSTTLLIAIHCEFGDRNFVSTFSIGDGLIGLIESNEVKLLCEPESGEFAGQTRFLDARAFKIEEYHSRIKTTISSDLKALLVMTDGISDPKFDSYEDFSDINVWNALVDEISTQINPEDSAATETNLISWAQFKSPGHHDDRSISFLLGK